MSVFPLKNFFISKFFFTKKNFLILILYFFFSRYNIFLFIKQNQLIFNNIIKIIELINFHENFLKISSSIMEKFFKKEELILIKFFNQEFFLFFCNDFFLLIDLLSNNILIKDLLFFCYQNVFINNKFLYFI